MSSEMMDTTNAGGGVAAGPLVTLTPEAADKVREFQAESPEMSVLRVSVIPGGCSGFEYGLDMDDQVRDDDFSFTSEGIQVVVDPFSAQYLTGVKIGYHSSFQGTGFTFENPNATGSCGCGTSFAV
jgi:iron-sulfur cluster assembly accessory protein